MSQPLKFTLGNLTEEDTLKKIYVVVSKTKSPYNRDLNELPAIKRIVEKYILNHPELAEIPVRVLPNFPNASFNFRKNELLLGLFNSSVLSHELEHVLSVADSPLYQGLLEKSRMLSNLSGRFTLPVSIGGAVKLHMPESSDLVNKAFDALSIAHGVGSLPTLYEEGKANLGAVWESEDKIDAIKNLLPAYASYVKNSATPIGLYQLAKYINKKD